ncbi:MAG: hypothetical protein KFB96_23730 [Thiocapsa sp.]|uniref:hypothetical protein n=1 Tax=Thiocapsa sp. TaxID=2024551 RepID=UPI001BCF261C|nr:hypothetical protein [Thiocapsa sp.]QVL48556.1 MAG: hypothetical protein KFB96_23730 [Thiocapsa sp.]
MSSHPLTHHEIFTLVEPFTRRGRHVDLAASDRLERRLLFKPFDHGEDRAELSGVRELLLLENPKPDRFRLTRTLRDPDGLEADLVVEGPDPGELLDRIEAIDPTRHFREKSGYRIARSYRLESAEGGGVDAATPTRLLLTRGAAQFEGLTLTMKAQTGRGMPAELELHAEDGDTIVLPEDMLAVIGWDWRRLNRVKSCWKSTLRLRGKEPDRSRDAEMKLTRTVEHLAETLREPPVHYHERLVAARWNVAFRRALPLLIGLGLILGAPAIQFLELSEGSLIRMLIFHSPPLLMVLFFTMKEMPRIEIPPFPKPLTTSAWREAPSSPTGEMPKTSPQEA